VIRQARSLAIPLYLLPDFLKVTKEHSRIFDIAVRSAAFGFSIACHTPFTV
jgi:hypothetical protein